MTLILDQDSFPTLKLWQCMWTVERLKAPMACLNLFYGKKKDVAMTNELSQEELNCYWASRSRRLLSSPDVIGRERINQSPIGSKTLPRFMRGLHTLILLLLLLLFLHLLTKTSVANRVFRLIAPGGCLYAILAIDVAVLRAAIGITFIQSIGPVALSPSVLQCKPVSFLPRFPFFP